LPNDTTFAMREHTVPPLSRTPQPGPKLAVLVPTRNEAANIEELLWRLAAAVIGIPTVIVFVDDSDDDTPAVIRAVAPRRDGGACQVALIHRRGGQRTGGLGGAVVDGLRATEAPWACVLDADLQHPPEVVPRLLTVVERDGADLAVASRYCGTGRTDGLGPARSLISTGCGSAAKLLVRHGGLRTTEVGYTFADRHAGESKGTLREGLTYLASLADLRLGRGTPPPARTIAAEVEPLAPLTPHTMTVEA
jgi:dolichol-phosphate mannosyltransferase